MIRGAMPDDVLAGRVARYRTSFSKRQGVHVCVSSGLFSAFKSLVFHHEAES